MEAHKIPIIAAPKYKEAIKAIPGANWDPVQRCWFIPCTVTAADALRCIPGVPVPEELAQLAPIDMQDTAFEGAVPLRPMPIRVKPYAHQIAAYNLAITEPAAALLHEQGCGKSLTAIAATGRRYLDGQIRKLLIVAPLAVLPVWEREFTDYSTIPHRVTLLQGDTRRRAQQLDELDHTPGAQLDIVVINYEAVRLLEKELTAWAPDMILCDESQRIKTPTAKQSKVMHNLGQRAQYRMILTGTPVSNTPLDFWSQYAFLKPGLFERSYYAFRNHYAVMGGYGGYEIVKYKCLDDLTRKAHSIAHRVTKDQALDLPERIDQTLYCELEPKAAKLYKELVRDRVAELSALARVTTPQVVTQMLRLSQLTGGYLVPDDGTLTKVSDAKRQLLRETLEDLLERGEKVVIFCRFRAEIAEICALAEKLTGKDGYRGIWGEIPGEQRGEAVRTFQQDPGVRIFIAQIQCAGAGITLHAASTAIFYSLDYSFNNYDQAKARIHRIGQHRPCTYLHLVAKDTIDELVLKTLAEKRSIADAVVDNWKAFFNAKGERK